MKYSCGLKFTYTHCRHECCGHLEHLVISLNCVFFPMRNGFTAYIFINLKKTELHAQV